MVKYSDLHTLSNVSTWSRFTHFLVFWLDLAIYALCRILMKCRDLRTFPGTNYRFPGTKNFSTPLLQEQECHKQDEDEDDDWEEEREAAEMVTYRHLCVNCGHIVSMHKYQFWVEEGRQEYRMDCLLCGFAEDSVSCMPNDPRKASAMEL